MVHYKLPTQEKILGNNKKKRQTRKWLKNRNVEK